jgi:hypothetical protein
MLSHRLKGKWSSRRRQGFHSTPSYYLPFAVTPHHSPLWYNPSLIYFFARGEENLIRALKTPFLAINAKGGESIIPKQKDRTTMPISKIFETCLSFKCCSSIGIFEINIPLRNFISLVSKISI